MNISDMMDGPVDLVTFDLYDTLVEASPPRWERFYDAVTTAGFQVTQDDVLRADTAGETFYTIENGRLPIRDRGRHGVAKFRLELARVSMKELGLPTDDETVLRVQKLFHDETENHAAWEYRAFKEVPDVLDFLARHHVKRAVISNADADVTRFCLQMGFAEHMDVIVTSALVGWEKPDARTFYAALEPLDVPAHRALHVGDQQLSDIVGARNIGMGAALLDRYNRHDGHDVHAYRVRSLMELAQHVVEYNAEFDGESA